MSTAHTKQLFRKLLSLQGRSIEVGLRTSGEQIKGLLVNVMFDSFLVRGTKEIKVISFENILYLDELEAPAK